MNRSLDLHWTRADAAAVLVIGLAIAVRWWRIILPTGSSFESGDFVDQFFAFARFETASLAAGHAPLHNPHAYAGSPFWPDIQSAVTYPLSMMVVLWSVLSGQSLPYRALEIEAIAHIGLAGLFTYALARQLLGHRLAALLAATAFGISGWIGGYPPLQLAVLETITWLPLALLAVVRTVDRPRSWPLLALAVAMLVLAGHPQTTLHALYAVAAFAAWRMATDGRAPVANVEPAASPGAHVLRALAAWVHGHRSTIGGLAMAMLVGAGLSAPTWLPAAAFLNVSNRASLSYAELAHGFPPVELLGLLVPAVTLWSPLYVGVAPLLLAMIAAAGLLFGRSDSSAVTTTAYEHPAINQTAGSSPGKSLAPPVPSAAGSSSKPTHAMDDPFWLGLAAVALLFSVGGNGIVFDFFYHLAPGFDLFRGQERAAGLVAFSIAMLTGSGARTLLGCLQDSPATARRHALILAAGAAAIATLWVVSGAFRLPRADSAGPTLLAPLLVALCATLTLRPVFAPSLRSHAVAAILVLAVVIDLVSVGGTTNLSPEPPAELRPSPAQMILAQAGMTGRVHDHEDRGSRRWPPNAGMLHSYPSLDGASPLRLQSYDALRGAIGADEQLLWALFAVSFVVSERATISGAERLISTLDGDGLFVLHAPYQRAWRVAHAERTTIDEAAERLREPGFDPQMTVLLHDSDGGGPHGIDAALTVVDIPRPGTLAARTDAPGPGWLVVSEIFDPAWSATVDGQPADVLRANVGLLAVPVPAGSSEVWLEYVPRGVRVSLLIGLASALILGAVVARGFGTTVGRAVAGRRDA